MKITTLDNGLKIVTQNKDFEKIVIGAFIGTGLVNETDDINGISHFLEHMAFKGTKTKTAKELAEQIECLGGYTNAFTSNDVTAYYVGLLPKDWKIGIDFLADVLQNSTFPEDELEKERNVILEELARAEDNPNRVLWHNFMKNTYQNSNLKNKILGTKENIKKFTSEDLNTYMKKWYAFDNMIISACGKIDHDEFVEYIKSAFINLTAHAEQTELYAGFYNGIYDYTSKFDQAHILLGLPGLNASSDKNILFSIFLDILDGGMSCRLFQEIREKRGLAYSVSTVDEYGKDFGFFGVYLGVSKENIDKAISVTKDVLRSMITDITDEEFNKAKNITLFNLANKYDSCSALMLSNAQNLFYKGYVESYDDIKGKIDGITKQDIFNFAKDYIIDNFSISILRPDEQ